jgi:putative addiction module killer protein
MKYELKPMPEFTCWLSGLKDRTLHRRVLTRLARVEEGNFGDYKEIADNLYELRCFFGGGLRMYYTLRNNVLVILLAGGDKSTQKADIARAIELAETLEDSEEN